MRIETSYDPDWRRWIAEILDDDGDFAGLAIGSTEQAAIDEAQRLIDEQSPEFAAPETAELEY